jgi:lysozyme
MTTPTRLMFDLSHNNPLPTATYAADQALFVQALQGGWPMMMHKLSQGASFQDPAALGRLKYGAAAGLFLGGYHFMTADPISSQIANFMHMAGQAKQIVAPAPLMLCIDNEPGPDNPAPGMERATAATDASAAEFVTAVYQTTGIWPLAYGGRYAFFSAASLGNLAACPLWLAEYGTNPVCPPGWLNWRFHQYSDGHAGPSPVSIPGIGRVDQSEFAGSQADLAALFVARR